MNSPLTPAKRIENLVRSGSIDAAEAHRLLGAMGEESAPPRTLLRLFTHPFERLGGEVTTAVGLVVAALSASVAHLGIRYDGALDVHLVHHEVGLRTALVDQLVGWVLPSLVLFAYARALSPGRRLRDFTGAVGVARLPLLLMAPFLLVTAPATPIDPVHPPLRVLVVALLSLGFVVPFFVLLYRGFANASGLRDRRKLWGGFVAMVLVAEVLSKIVLAIAV